MAQSLDGGNTAKSSGASCFRRQVKGSENESTEPEQVRGLCRVHPAFDGKSKVTNEWLVYKFFTILLIFRQCVIKQFSQSIENQQGKRGPVYKVRQA